MMRSSEGIASLPAISVTRQCAWPRWWVWWLKKCAKRRRKRLGDVLRPDDGAVGEGRGEVGFRQAVDIGDDAVILDLARGVERIEILEQDLVEPGLHGALAGEAAEPDAVGDDEMVEGAVERAEEGAARRPVVGVGKGPGGRVEAAIGPAVVAGEHLEVILHQRTPSRSRGDSARVAISPFSTPRRESQGGWRALPKRRPGLTYPACRD